MIAAICLGAVYVGVGALTITLSVYLADKLAQECAILVGGAIVLGVCGLFGWSVCNVLGVLQ